MLVSTLRNLALQTYGKWAAEAFLSATVTEEDKYKQIIQICRSLHELPFDFADDVTSVMLQHLEPHWAYLEFSHEIMQLMVLSVIHPKVHTLDISRCPDIGECVMNTIKSCSSSVQRFPNLDTLMNLKLKKFICRSNCNDEMLDALKFCADIEYIDVRKSWEVTDESIELLLSLSQLKYLNIDGTSISPNRLSKLLKGIHNKKTIPPLVKFYCPKISTDQLRLLIRFTNLTHIGLEASMCDISALNDLKHLKSILIRNCGFSSLRGTFQEIGGNIRKIRLELIEQVDIKFIAETFPKLEALVLKSCTYRRLAPNAEQETLPPFKNLKNVELYGIESKELLHSLSSCFNLIEVKVDTDVQFEEPFTQIPGIGCLKTLEKFILYTRMNRVLPKFNMEQLFQNCSNLRVFKNVGLEREDVNTETLKKEMEAKYPLISITIITTKWPFLRFNQGDNPEYV